MSVPIWPVVCENLAEQIASTQAGRVHPTQLIPFLPMSLELIKETLDGMIISDRIEADRINDLECYTFLEYIDRPVTEFRPENGVYSHDPIKPNSGHAITEDVRNKIEGELGAIAASDPWPSQAVWQHELIYLIQNLPNPVYLSAIAGHSRLPFSKVEEKLKELQKMGAIQFDLKSMTFSLPPLSYSKEAFRRQERYIRQFPGAVKEEDEIRLVKGLLATCGILAVCFVIAFTARLPFPLLLIGGLAISAVNFIRILKKKPKSLPEL